MPSTENILVSFDLDFEVMACTGHSGFPNKTFMVAAFQGDPDLFSRQERKELRGVTIDEKMCTIFNLKVLAGASSINCGISSNH